MQLTIIGQFITFNEQLIHCFYASVSSYDLRYADFVPGHSKSILPDLDVKVLPWVEQHFLQAISVSLMASMVTTLWSSAPTMFGLFPAPRQIASAFASLPSSYDFHTMSFDPQIRTLLHADIPGRQSPLAVVLVLVSPSRRHIYQAVVLPALGHVAQRPSPLVSFGPSFQRGDVGQALTCHCRGLARSRLFVYDAFATGGRGE